MRGSTCVIAVLLLMVVFLQTFFLESISSSDAEENAGQGTAFRWDLEEEASWSTCVTLASLEMKEGEYEVRRKKETCVEL